MAAGKRRRILVIDDDPEVADRLEQLAEDRFEVVCIADANEVLKRVVSETWDLLLVDINLLIIRGDSLVKVLIERAPRGKRPPILYFSAEDEGRLARLARETCVEGYVSKGRRNAEILETIESHLA